MVTSVRMAPPLLIVLLMIHGVSSAGLGVSYSPAHICALKDSSVIMNCTYTYPTGHQIMRVFWSKDPLEKGVEPPDLSKDPEYSQRLQYLGDKQQICTIRLSHVTLKDSHEYYFRFITNKQKLLVFTEEDKWIGVPGVTLTVTDLQVESPERVTEGDSVRLTCKSSCTLTDRATFIWYRNSQPLTERRDRNNELLLQSVRREDAGRYSCAVHGHNHISPAVQLNVTYAPRSVSVSISPSGEIVSGDSVTLNCSSDSNPPAEIRWVKGRTFVGSGRIYNISKISSDDSGEYKCRSINEHGEKYSDAVTLNIMYPPRNVSVSIIQSGQIWAGYSVTLICSSDSNPPALNFSWFKENESSAVGSGQSFSALQSGRFYCQAHNQHGSQRSDAVTVTVKERDQTSLNECRNTVGHSGVLEQTEPLQEKHLTSPHGVSRRTSPSQAQSFRRRRINSDRPRYQTYHRKKPWMGASSSCRPRRTSNSRQQPPPHPHSSHPDAAQGRMDMPALDPQELLMLVKELLEQVLPEKYSEAQDSDHSHNTMQPCSSQPHHKSRASRRQVTLSRHLLLRHLLSKLRDLNLATSKHLARINCTNTN
ncbi:sialoadhesin-like [Chanodichthys erythropterus]|uniref:sialoadhesin-like n=1 Tax=Chanodichthys erythropterus TaxID=933992 RepID=UPI00351F2FF5